MEERIEGKMTEVVEYILTKPKETITADEYMILASELKDARFRREQAEQGDKFAKLLATVFPGFNSPEVKPEVKPAVKAVKTPAAKLNELGKK